MTEKPLYAPGCFGLPSTFGLDEICGGCVYAKECEIVHVRALRQLRSFCGVEVKEPTRARGELPAKVKKIFEELGKSMTEVREAMQVGQNPYPLKAGFVGIACHVLLQCKTTTRKTIATVIAAHRKYSFETADIYARHAIQILCHCGAIRIDGDQIHLTSEHV